MLSNKKIICPDNLIKVAKKTGTVDAAIVNAGEIFPMESVHKAVQHNLINPIFIGNESEIIKHAKKLDWDISKYKLINEKNETVAEFRGHSRTISGQHFQEKIK